MPLRQRELQTIPSRSRLLKGMVFFGISITLVAFNYLTTAAAFLLCVLAFLRIKIIDGNFYRDIDWPIVIMLAAMIPIGGALQTTGLSEVISNRSPREPCSQMLGNKHRGEGCRKRRRRGRWTRTGSLPKRWKAVSRRGSPSNGCS